MARSRYEQRRATERRRIRTIPVRAIVALVAVAAVAVALVFVFVNGDDDAAIDRRAAPGPLPEWLQDVAPPPGGEMTGAIAVSVRHELLAGNREVRLVIDGVDVTDQSQPQPQRQPGQEGRPGPVGTGQITYDPQQVDRPLVRLEPGRHEAEARLVEYPGDVLEQEGEVVDTFRWEFSIF